MKRSRRPAPSSLKFSTTFDTFERNVRDQLARILGAGGFDPARDIIAITVNRWPHGYAYTYNSLVDPMEWVYTSTNARPEASPASTTGTTPASAGVFRLDAHSAISGRLLQQVVDQAGAGRGSATSSRTACLYVVVESTQLNWQFTVEEAIGYP